MRHHRAGGEEAGGDRNAELSGISIARDDRPGHLSGHTEVCMPNVIAHRADCPLNYMRPPVDVDGIQHNAVQLNSKHDL
jgi:hypothetical protein